MILFKLLSKGVVEEICGCVSTGKEANVYYAIACQEGQQRGCAVKVCIELGQYRSFLFIQIHENTL
jgi:serine/threonine-protein kinase RIO1